jgi:AbiTii
MAFMPETKAALLSEIEAAVLDESVPVASALRKCLVLGAKAGSEQLRSWARQELNGYDPESDVPEYRVVQAPITVDTMNLYAISRGQRISQHMLPEEARKAISESVTLVHSIAVIEDMANQAKASDGRLKLSPPGAAELATLMILQNREHGNDLQVMSVYWQVSEVAFRGVVDRVRTILIELVAELRVAQPNEQADPPAQAVQTVVTNVFTGRSRVGTVLNAQATNGGHAVATGSLVASAPEDTSRWWTSKKLVDV